MSYSIAELVSQTSATQGAPLGEEGYVPANRLYRYSRNGPKVLPAGSVIQALRPNTSHDNLTCAAAPVSALSVTVTLASGDPLTVDEYKNGYVYINDEAGEGFVYDIAGNEGGGGEDSTKKISLRDPIVVALTTSSQATLVKNIYDGVNVPGGDQWDILVGVAPVAVPADAYFWAQVRGPAAVLQAGGLFRGRGVMLSPKKPGAVEVIKQVIPTKERGGAEALGGAVAPEAKQFTQKALDIRLDSRTERNEPPDLLIEFSGMATVPERVVGYCINPRVGQEYALVYLTLS